jgi:hypothetical protein
VQPNGPPKKRRRRSDSARIVELFTDRRDSYTEAELMRLTRTPRAELATLIEDGLLHPDRAGEFGWEDVAFVALTVRWSFRKVASILVRALGPGVVPYLNRPATIQVQLPLYQVLLLRAIARRHPGLTAGDILEPVIADVLAAPNREELDREIRGFNAAVFWPFDMEDREFIRDSDEKEL